MASSQQSMQESVATVEKLAKKVGCAGSNADLIAFSTGFSAGSETGKNASVEKQVAELTAEVARLKIMLAANEGGVAAKAAQPTASDSGRAVKGTVHSLTTNEKIGGAFKLQANPPFIAKRLEVYNRLKKNFDAIVAAKPRSPIKITLPDGKVLDGTAWETTPAMIAKGISNSMCKKLCVAEVVYTGTRVGSMDVVAAEKDMVDDATENDAKGSEALQWDVFRPLEGDCKLTLRLFEDKDKSTAGKTTFWHSSAHVLGQAMERCFGVKLTIGPPLKDGFYYDCYSGTETISEDKWYKAINDMTKKIVKEKQDFERIVCSKQEALELFAANPFKLAIITTKVPDGSFTTVYRNGPFVDLCMGPHVATTKYLAAIAVTKHSATYWRGSDKCDSLQRMYGIAFPHKKHMAKYKKEMELRKQRDHRKIGGEQQLVFWHELSPGSAFFLPHGARLYSRMMQFIRTQYWKRGYDEVISPNIYDSRLFKISGHYQKYAKDMYWIQDGKDEFGLKPMNCPGHCLMFRNSQRSHRELPIRFADFGALHRNEIKGALSGLVRVRRFQQDDAHIFCRMDQVEDEVVGALEFMKYVYAVFGMTFKLERSTRPESAVGADTPKGVAIWDAAEGALTGALDKFAGKGNWCDNPGDGAFYGPKIDIKVLDCMGRRHQCATVQLDFQLPIRFDLTYKAGQAAPAAGGAAKQADKAAGKAKNPAKKGVFKNLPNSVAEPAPGLARPVMVHRAMLGSVERMMAILIEHFAGKWPLWCSPRQVMIVPLHVDYYDYALEVKDRLKAHGFFTDADISGDKYKKKIRGAQLMGYNYTLVVGKDEMAEDTVSVRVRGEQASEKGVKVDEFIARLRQESDACTKSPELIAQLKANAAE